MNGPIQQAKDDHAAGRRDEVRYADMMTRDGEIYRKTWQQARRDAEALADGILPPAPEPEPPPPKPEAEGDVPDFAIAPEPVIGIDLASTPDETVTIAFGVDQTKVPEVTVKSVEITLPTPKVEDVRLHAGEDKPRKKKAKQTPDDQLGLFS